MAKQQTALVDPVAGDQERHEKEAQEAEISTMTIDGLKLEDFKPMPVDAAKPAHPFEGYPMQKIRVGEYNDRGQKKDLMLYRHGIIALNPKEYVHQDPSGLRHSQMKDGKEIFVDFKTFHNRIVIDQNGQNITVIFDREIKLADGNTLSRVAYCPDHTARAQIFFKIEPKTGKVAPDRRYLLADGGQTSRLRRVFEQFHYQQTQSERAAKKFDEEAESKAQ